MKRIIPGLLVTLTVLALFGRFDDAYAAVTSGPPVGSSAESIGTPSGPAEHTPVWRAQLYIRVCDVPHAGTADTVVASLRQYEYGEYTALDTPLNDFQRASGVTFDLLISRFYRLDFIQYLKIYKAGTDGVCIQNLQLFINEKVIYTRTYPAGWWLDGTYSGYDTRTLLIPGSTLRSSSVWRAWTPPPQPDYISSAGIGIRLATATGTGMHDYNLLTSRHSLHWGGSGAEFYGDKVEPIATSYVDGTAIRVRVRLRFKCVDFTFGDEFCADETVHYVVTLRFRCDNLTYIVVTKENERVDFVARGAGGAAKSTIELAVKPWVGPRIQAAFGNLKFPNGCPSIHVYPATDGFGDFSYTPVWLYFGP
jgi:hypothetical protein